MTPEQRDRDREYFRIWEEAKRRERGIPPRRFRHRQGNVIVGIARPIRTCRSSLLVATVEQVVVPDVELGRKAGVPPRSIYRLRKAEVGHVRLDLADRLAVALGVPLPVIYGDTPTVPLAVPPQLRVAS